MNLHKNFCVELGKLRRSTVGDIVKSLNIVNIENGNITNLKDGLFELEQIFYTVDYLKKNEFVYVESKQIGSYVPDFNPNSFIKKESDKYLISQMHAMPQFLQNYWGIGLVINPTYAKFIQNKFRTDEEVEKFWNRWLPFFTAVVASVLASVVTAILTSKLTSYSMINCF